MYSQKSQIDIYGITFYASIRSRTKWEKYQSANKCPVLTKIVQPPTLKGLCALICGLRNQTPLG